MNGVQLTLIPRNGQIRSVLLMVFSILIAGLLCSCSFDPNNDQETDRDYGRGDWTLNLVDGYCIVKTNSNSIHLCKKESYDESASEFVIQNTFVNAYQISEPYICIKGIIHEDKFHATEQELDNGVNVYYVVDTDDGTVHGPLNLEEFQNTCDLLTVNLNEEWIKINRTGYKADLATTVTSLEEFIDPPANS